MPTTHLDQITPVTISVNRRSHHVAVPPGTSLLDVLRDELHLTGTKEGCAEGECGACTVLIDGRPIDACLMAAHAAASHEVTTIEGVSAPVEPSALQTAIVEAGGVQCGFCTPGIVMTLTALLDVEANPDEATVRRSLAGNICRCTGYAQIVEAVLGLVDTTGDDEEEVNR